MMVLTFLEGFLFNLLRAKEILLITIIKLYLSEPRPKRSN